MQNQLDRQLTTAKAEIGLLREALLDISRIGENDYAVSPLTARCIMLARRALAAGQPEAP